MLLVFSEFSEKKLSNASTLKVKMISLPGREPKILAISSAGTSEYPY